MNQLKNKINYKYILVIIGILFLVFLFKTSYAYLYTTIQGERKYSLTVKGYSIKLDETSTSENINLSNSIPMSDEEGKLTEAYTFSIINEDTSETGYILYLDDVVIEDEVNRMSDTKVKYQLIENDVETVGLVSELGVNPLRILTYGIIGAGSTNNYSLRFWIDEKADVFSSEIFSVKLRIIATSKDVIESGKLNPGETIVTTENGTTEMTNEQLQTYIEKYVNNASSDICKECQNIISDQYDSTKTYTKGDYVIYNNTLYKANQDITTAEEFDSTKWNATNVNSEITTINNNLYTPINIYKHIRFTLSAANTYEVVGTVTIPAQSFFVMSVVSEFHYDVPSGLRVSTDSSNYLQSIVWQEQSDVSSYALSVTLSDFIDSETTYYIWAKYMGASVNILTVRGFYIRQI